MGRKSSREVTAELLIKRLDTGQLLGLIGLEGYEPFQPRIMAKLQTQNGLTLTDFKKVHPTSEGCTITNVEVGKTLPVVCVDPRGEFPDAHYDLPLMRLKCQQHSIASRQYVANFGDIYEEPFIPRYR